MGTSTVAGDIWFYYPSAEAAIAYAAVFGIICCGTIYRACQGGIRRFFWAILVGIGMEVGGFACRAVAAHQLDQVAPYAAQQSLIVLATLFIAAGNYLVISRLICGAGKVKHEGIKVFKVPARRITPIFVTSDILSILVQVSGTTIAAAGKWVGSTADIGSHVLLTGLAIQTASMAFFLAIVLKFEGLRLFTIRSDVSAQYFNGLCSTFISGIFIEIRCIFRLIEWATGIHGYLFTHEWSFYLLDATLMIIAIGTFVIWYPPHYIPREGLKDVSKELSGVEKGPASEGRMPES